MNSVYATKSYDFDIYLKKEYQKLQDPNLNLFTLFITNISEGYFVYD